MLPVRKPKHDKEFQLNQILFLTDSLQVFDATEGNEDLINRSFVMDCFYLSKCFAFIEFRHFSRVLNVAKHSMDKFCIIFS